MESNEQYPDIDMEKSNQEFLLLKQQINDEIDDLLWRVKRESTR